MARTPRTAPTDSLVGLRGHCDGDVRENAEKRDEKGMKRR